MAGLATSYRFVDHSSVSFEPITKQGKLYVANLSPTLLILAPPVELVSSLESEAPFAYIRPVGEFATFLRDTEAFILDQCIKRKAEWFRKGLDDDALRHNFKSFFRDNDFKVKVADVAAFGVQKEPVGQEDIPVGKHVRCVLELSRICFGRQEFGAMWRLAQVREVEVPACMIQDERDDEDEPAGESVDECGGEPDADEHEFL